MKNIIISFAAILLFAVSASAQIGGRVTDAQGNGLPNVTIVATGEDGELASTVTTDEDGAYAFEDLGVGKYTITAKGSVAFRPAFRDAVNVVEDETTTLNTTLVAAVQAAQVRPGNDPAANTPATSGPLRLAAGSCTSRCRARRHKVV